MSAVATRERELGAPAVENRRAEPPAQHLFEPQGPTLEDSILATWDELTTAGRVACPVCSGEMSRANGCKSCGSELA
jgi:hypothetical protein